MIKYILSMVFVTAMVWSLPAYAANLKPPKQVDLDKVQAALPTQPTAKPLKPRRVLIFNLNEGYFHKCIPLAGKTFEMMGKKSGAYESVSSSDMSVFNAEYLATFDAVLLNNNTHLKFKNMDQRKALLDFVKGGKGIVGIHAASDSFFTWPEGAKMIGGQFNNHPWRANGTWAVKLDEPSHPINKGFGGKNFSINDEIYQIKGPYSRGTHRVLLSLDMTQDVNHKVTGIQRKDNDFAISWIKPCGGGRVFYSSLGHNFSVYWNSAVLQHYLDGIQYVLGDLKVDETPSSKLTKDSICDNISVYEFGGSKAALSNVASKITAASDVELAQIESELIHVLENPSATFAGKQFACRMLRRCGTKKSLPSLAALLGDKELSSMARFALQEMDCPQVDVALRKALAEVDQSLAIGIIGTIGQRRDALAVPALATIMAGQNGALANASAVALGRIGTPDAAKALSGAMLAGISIDAENSLLASADAMADNGNSGDAIHIYKKLYADSQDSMIKVAALRGLVLTEREKSLPLFIDLLKGGDDKLKKQIISIITELPPGLDITKTLAMQLPTLSSDSQVILIGGLAGRGDEVALSTINMASKSTNPEIKGAALRAFRILNDDSSVTMLLSVLGDPEEGSAIAAESLIRINNSGIGNSLVSEFNQNSDSNVRCMVIKILAARVDRSAMPLYLNALKDSDSSLSREATKALSLLGGAGEVLPILEILLSTDDSRLRRNAEKAISAIAVGRKNVNEITKPVAAALATNRDEYVAKALVGILKRSEGSVALRALQNETKTEDIVLRKEVVRALSGWSDESPAEDLLLIAQTDSEDNIKVLALRGYVGLAGNLGGSQGVEMCQKALNTAVRPDDIKIIIGVAGTLEHGDALALIKPFLSIDEFKAEAEVSYNSITSALAE